MMETRLQEFLVRKQCHLSPSFTLRQYFVLLLVVKDWIPILDSGKLPREMEQSMGDLC